MNKRRHAMKPTVGLLSSAVALAVLVAACSSPTGGPLGVAQSALRGEDFHAGEHPFENALPHTNGRACATCHIESEHLALSPEHVATLFLANPTDPLFNRID